MPRAAGTRTCEGGMSPARCFGEFPRVTVTFASPTGLSRTRASAGPSSARPPRTGRRSAGAEGVDDKKQVKPKKVGQGSH